MAPLLRFLPFPRKNHTIKLWDQTPSIAAQRSVPTAGVMIALALVPSALIVGMGRASGKPSLAGQAALRWLVDVGCVLAGGAVVFGAKRMLLNDRPATAAE